MKIQCPCVFRDRALGLIWDPFHEIGLDFDADFHLGIWVRCQ